MVWFKQFLLIFFIIIDLYVINGLPGEIQFINVKEQKKLGTFKIASRHNSVKVDDIEPNPVEINHVNKSF